MGYVPKDAKWFIAEIVEEITVEGDVRNVVHVNFNLIRAESPEEAYELAIELGKNGETEYDNLEGKQVRIRFCGLRELRVVHDELGHGAELMFEKHTRVLPDQVKSLLRSKEQLEVFTPWKAPDVNELDYASREVLDEVDRRYGPKRFDGMGRSNGPDSH